MADTTRPMPAIMKISELDEHDDPLKLGIYGDSGSGKTHLLAGLGERDLIIACEPGIITAIKEKSAANVVKCFDWPSFQYIIDQLARGAGKKFRAIGIDGYHTAQANLMRHLSVEGARGNDRRDPDKPALEDYGIAQSRFRRYTQIINGLPQHVIYTLTAMDSEDEEGEPIVLPNLWGKNGSNDPTNMAKDWMGSLHAYGYLKVRRVREEDEPDEEGKPKFRDSRRLLFRRSGPYYGKDRYGTFSPYIDDPTMGDILARANITE